ETFLTGFAEGNINGNETVDRALERIKTTAQSQLIENIKVSMSSNTRSEMYSNSVNGNYIEDESLYNATEKSSAAEIVGMKVESYYDKKSKMVYAFVYANKHELLGFYKAKLSSDVMQLEGILQTAKNLEVNKEKAKARQQLPAIQPLLVKIHASQELLIAIDTKIAAEDLQQAKVKQMLDDLAQIQARLDVKYEILEKFQNRLTTNITQIDGFLKTATELENSGEKPKARQQCEMAKNALVTVRTIQDSMVMVEPKITSNELQTAKTEQFHNEITQMSARLAQAVLVFIKSNEDLFGAKVNIVANKLKSELAVNGCSFIDDETKADLKFKINVSTRESSSNGNIVFCFVDVSYELYDAHKQKVVFSDEIAEKGGSTSQDKAARKAMENAVNKIINKISIYIK
ncbi:MAG: hypothetical protein LBT04_05005, partial [Prevotellaceae bacterium]|nr:hypothetical protein [Prevotellaceae bacterium]